MFCDKCGKENPQGSAFCQYCGNPMASSAPQPQSYEAPQNQGGFNPTPMQLPKMNINWKKILTFAIPGVVILALILIFVSCLGSCGAEGALKAYFEGEMFGNNPKAYMEVMVDPVQMEYYIDEGKYDDKNDMLDEYKDDCEDTKESYREAKKEYGASAKYEVKKTYKYDKDEIEALGEYFEEYYEEYGYDADDIQDAVTFKVKVTVKIDGEKESYTDEVTFVKIKGKWCYKSISRDTIKDLD